MTVTGLQRTIFELFILNLQKGACSDDGRGQKSPPNTTHHINKRQIVVRG